MATTNALVSLSTTLNATAITTYATDTAFVVAKGSSAAEGDFYFNTTYSALRAYQNGAWHFVKTAVLLSFASDTAFVTAKGASAAAGDIYENSTDGEIHAYSTAWKVIPRSDSSQHVLSSQIF